jgi:hypothetical protein
MLMGTLTNANIVHRRTVMVNAAAYLPGFTRIRQNIFTLTHKHCDRMQMSGALPDGMAG